MTWNTRIQVHGSSLGKVYKLQLSENTSLSFTRKYKTLEVIRHVYSSSPFWFIVCQKIYSINIRSRISKCAFVLIRMRKVIGQRKAEKLPPILPIKGTMQFKFLFHKPQCTVNLKNGNLPECYFVSYVLCSTFSPLTWTTALKSWYTGCRFFFYCTKRNESHIMSLNSLFNKNVLPTKSCKRNKFNNH